MSVPSKKIISCFALISALSANPVLAQRNAAAFLNGMVQGMQDAEISKRQRAETALIEMEATRLKQEKSASVEAQKSVARNAFAARWAAASEKPLQALGRRNRSNDKPEEWSDESLALKGAKLLSDTVIEVYRLADLSPAMTKRLQAGSTVDRMAIDCKKGMITGLDTVFFQLSNGLGSPTSHIIGFEILTKPFTPSYETIYEKSCDQLNAFNWVGEVSRLIASAKINDGIDYDVSREKRVELDGLVRSFGQEATEKGMSDDGLAASNWALQQAHATMKMRYPNK